MFQLIIIVFTIALVAMLATASINYLPVWNKEATDVEIKVRTGLGSVEQAYDVATRSRDGVPAHVSSEADGGFFAEFIPYLRLMPPTPNGYEWSYGLHPVDESKWSGLNYFCLSPLEGSAEARFGVARGIFRAQSNFSDDQFILAVGCGQTANWTQANEQADNLSITFFVAYTPGVTR